MLNSWIWVLLLVFSLRTYRHYLSDRGFFLSRREKRCSLLFGFFFLCFFYTGFALNQVETLTGETVFLIGLWSVMTAAGGGLGYVYLTRFLNRFFQPGLDHSADDSPYVYLRDALILFISWIPVFLALYPGLFAFDVDWQLVQNYGNYSTHHPLLHTLYLQFFYQLGERLGSYNLGMAFYVLVQMFFLALSFAYLIRYLRRIRGRRKAKLLLIYMAALPIYSVMAVSITKDILFTASFAVLFVLACQFNHQFSVITRRSWFFGFVLTAVCTALFRNNGIYTVVGLLMAMLFGAVRKKQFRVRVICLALISLSLFKAADSVLMVYTAAYSGSKNEMMSIPYQQLARVYALNGNEIEEEDKRELERLLPNIGNYNKHKSDSVKEGAFLDGGKNIKSLVKLYVKYGLKNPKLYVEATLLTTMGFWYMDDVSNAEMYGDVSGLLLMNIIEGYGVTHESRLPGLDWLLKVLFHQNYYQKIPVMAVLFSMALYFWLMILSLVYAIQERKKHIAVPSVFLMTYVATIFAGPCALMRYALPYIVCAPILAAAVFGKKPSA